jgi:hypothetical protein
MNFCSKIEIFAQNLNFSPSKIEFFAQEMNVIFNKKIFALVSAKKHKGTKVVFEIFWKNSKKIALVLPYVFSKNFQKNMGGLL